MKSCLESHGISVLVELTFKTQIAKLTVSTFRIYSSTSNLLVSIQFSSNEIFAIGCTFLIQVLQCQSAVTFKEWWRWLNLPFVWSLSQHLDSALKEPAHPSLLFSEFADYNRRALWPHGRIHTHLRTQSWKKTRDQQNPCLSRTSLTSGWRYATRFKC